MKILVIALLHSTFLSFVVLEGAFFVFRIVIIVGLFFFFSFEACLILIVIIDDKFIGLYRKVDTLVICMNF